MLGGLALKALFVISSICMLEGGKALGPLHASCLRFGALGPSGSIHGVRVLSGPSLEAGISPSADFIFHTHTPQPIAHLRVRLP